MATNSKFRPGSRFHLTQLGAERCSKYGAQTGTVIGLSNRSNNIVRVQLDGTKRTRSLHQSYIEIIANEGQLKGLSHEGIVSGDLVGPGPHGGDRSDRMSFDTEG
jgi:hypothetical protein